jgi:hypothetical protein
MKPASPRHALTAALACVAAAALAPATASASTWTVDDDKAQCPNAAFTSIQAAVDQAAPWDTVVVCDGLYLESSTPTNHPNSPAQAGSQNGLTIRKPLTIRGAGAGKVTIRPAAELGASLAGTAPYLRDGGGNVVTISRQSLGSSDDNENFVDISGVTIESPTAYAEAGVAFFNTSGRIADSRIGPLLTATTADEASARPHGWGVIQTNSLQGAEAGARRELSIVDSLVTGYQAGGILFDEARGADASATVMTRSGMVGYGYATGTRVQGIGPTSLFPQTGIRYHAGARGAVTGSEITGNEYTPDRRQSAGILLTDAETGADPSYPGTRAFDAAGNAITGNGHGLFNADITNTAVRSGAPARATANWWGCNTGPVFDEQTSDTCARVSGRDAGGEPSMIGWRNLSAPESGPLSTAPAALTVPAATADAPPGGGFATADFVVAPDAAIDPVVWADDDFGVASVALTIAGEPAGALTQAPYEFAPAWTASAADIGQTLPLEATITDSSGQTTTVSSTVLVVSEDFLPVSISAGSWNAGTVLVGSTSTQALTVTNTSPATVRMTTIAVTGDAFSTSGGNCAEGLVLAPAGTCIVEVEFAPTAAGAVTGELSLTTAASPNALTVALSGTGVVPAPPSASPAATATPPAQVGAAPQEPGTVVTALLRRGRMTKAGTIRVGSVSCPAGKRCTVTVRGTLKIGKRRFALSGKKTVGDGRTATLSLKLGRQARSTLRETKRGSLTVRVTAGGRTTRATLSVRR